MADEVSDRIFLCPSCLTPAESAGSCNACGKTVIECRPGDPDDPCRRPLMNRKGEILTRAPVWWLRYQVGTLIEVIEQNKESE